VRLPSVFRRTPFRLTLSFLALFATAASALLLYVYFASQSEAANRARAGVERELSTLEGIYRERGVEALNAELIDRASRGGPYLFLLMDAEGQPRTGNVNESPIVDYQGGEQWESFRLSGADEQGRVARRWAMGVQLRLPGGELLFVGEDIGDSEQYLNRLSLYLWGAAGIVFLLGLGGGLLVSRQVEGAMARLNAVVDAARSGDLQQRVAVQNTGDELDELAGNLNAMLDRLEQSMASIRAVSSSRLAMLGPTDSRKASGIRFAIRIVGRISQYRLSIRRFSMSVSHGESLPLSSAWIRSWHSSMMSSPTL